ncbi:MAG: GAF domain-containing protein [Pseudomonadota bacterium]
MEPDLKNEIAPDLIAKADALALRFSDKLDCESVFISLASTDRLFPFGMSIADAPEIQDRVLLAKETICALTAERNEPLAFGDARKVDAIKNRAIVKSGAIVGYMGAPIRDVSGEAIGAICATTTVPRIWSEADRLILSNAALEAEVLLATARLKQENDVLSRALVEYDDIIGAIAKHADAMISIHGTSGTLIFATNALLTRLEPCELERQFHKAVASQMMKGLTGLNEPQITWGGAQDNEALHPTRQSQSGSLTFVKWGP